MLGRLNGAPPRLVFLVVGSFFIPPSSFPASSFQHSSIELLMETAALFFWQVGSDIGVHFALAPSTGYLVVRYASIIDESRC